MKTDSVPFHPEALNLRILVSSNPSSSIIQTLYIGDIVEVYTEERFLTDGKPDVQKINPFTLTMPDNHYWRVGEMAGRAWSAGKKLKG